MMDSELRRRMIERIQQRCAEYKGKRLDDGKLIGALVWPRTNQLTQDEIMTLLVEVWEIRGAARLVEKLNQIAEMIEPG